MCDCKVLKVGDVVLYRPCFGMEEPITAKVERLDLTPHVRDKYGFSVPAVPWCVVEANCVILSLDNSQWAYGEQVISVQS